jgi:hypothetical protein
MLSARRMLRKCRMLDFSQTCRPSLPVIGLVFISFYLFFYFPNLISPDVVHSRLAAGTLSPREASSQAPGEKYADV